MVGSAPGGEVGGSEVVAMVTTVVVVGGADVVGAGIVDVRTLTVLVVGGGEVGSLNWGGKGVRWEGE